MGRWEVGGWVGSEIRDDNRSRRTYCLVSQVIERIEPSSHARVILVVFSKQSEYHLLFVRYPGFLASYIFTIKFIYMYHIC